MTHPVTASDLLYRFGPFTVDPVLQGLYCGDDVISLSRKAFAVLIALIERHGSLVDRDELFTIVWPGVVVEENNLDRSVSMLRHALRQYDREHDYVLTVSGRGYQFCADVTRVRRAELDSFADRALVDTAPLATTPVDAAVPDAPPVVVPSPPAARPVPIATPPVAVLPAVASRLASRAARWGVRLAVSAGVAVAIGLTTAFLVHAASASSSMERFWRPVLSAHGTLAIVVGPVKPGADYVVTVHAARAVARIAGFLELESRPFEFKSTDSLDFASLRAQPMVAVGGFNNPWMRKMTDGLRFRFERSDLARIADHNHPEAPGWATRFDTSVDPPVAVEDFALIARVNDPASGQQVLCFGGIQRWGTAAAGELLTSQDYLDHFAATAPTGWERQNIELVIATTVTGDVAGPPRVVATHYWN